VPKGDELPHNGPSCLREILFFLLSVDCAVSRFDASRPRSRDYLPAGACDVITADTWQRRCRETFSERRRRRRQHESDTVRFIAVLHGDYERHTDDDDDDDDAGAVERPAVSSAAAGTEADTMLSQLVDELHLIVVRVWIVIDVLLLVRRMALTDSGNNNYNNYNYNYNYYYY